MKNLIGLSGGLLAITFLTGLSAQDKTVPFYIGTQDKGEHSSISLCELNLSTGQIVLKDTFNNCKGPGYLALSPGKKNLYAASGDNKISAFRVEKDHKLTFLNSESSEGMNPCHVSVHPSGKMVFAANYTGGSFSAYIVQPDGKVTPPTYTEQYVGSGPNVKRQDKAHAHFSTASPNGKFVYVADLGSDKVINYLVDVSTGKLTPNPAQPFYSAKPGSGPRHLTIHPSGKYLFLLNELDATVSSFSVDSNGKITLIETYVTLPAGFSGNNTSSAIHLHPNGKFVYVSNRGHNSITAFEIKAAGKLAQVDQQTRSISTPRDFNIDPSGKYMVVANQDKDNLTVYTVDPKTGKFAFKQESIAIKSPICVVF